MKKAINLNNNNNLDYGVEFNKSKLTIDDLEIDIKNYNFKQIKKTNYFMRFILLFVKNRHCFINGEVVHYKVLEERIYIYG